MTRYHIIVIGYVQGVGFRYFVYHIAKSLSLSGWVRNLYDGSVEIEVQGNEDDISSFIEDLWHGNRYAAVDDIKTKKIDILKKEIDFRIT